MPLATRALSYFFCWSHLVVDPKIAKKIHFQLSALEVVPRLYLFPQNISAKSIRYHGVEQTFSVARVEANREGVDSLARVAINVPSLEMFGCGGILHCGDSTPNVEFIRAFALFEEYTGYE